MVEKAYPAPTKSALKSMFECVVMSQEAYFEPQKVEICSPIVFHKYSTNYGGPLRKSGKYAAGCMTYYDMYETGKYENLVLSSETQRALIQLLNSKHTAEGSKHQAATVISPFSGTKTTGIGNKYPNPNIPLLGLTYLYSKKSDTPCLTRYTMTGAKAFQAGINEIRAISNALAFLTADSRKDRSWRAMTDSNREKPNLLLAYLPDDPQNNAYLAKILGDPSDSDDPEEYRETAEAVYEALCKMGRRVPKYSAHSDTSPG